MASVARTVTCCLILLAASACGTKDDLPAVQLTADQLQTISLTDEEFGPEYSDFVREDGWGITTLEQLVAATGDGAAEAEAAQRFGFLVSHVDSRVSPRAFSTLSGPISVSDTLLAFGHHAGAMAAFDDMIAAYQGMVSGTSWIGSLQGYKTFKVGAGDQAYGVTARFLTPGPEFGVRGVVNITVTTAALRRGSVIAEVTMVRFDAKDVRAEAIELARKLDRRIQAVLAGGAIEAPVVEVPSQPR